MRSEEEIKKVLEQCEQYAQDAELLTHEHGEWREKKQLLKWVLGSPRENNRPGSRYLRTIIYNYIRYFPGWTHEELFMALRVLDDERDVVGSYLGALWLESKIAWSEVHKGWVALEEENEK